ncbi:MAG TPA: hypothetical protein VFQ11_11295 [Nocardioidaceae bacterium]|jgi:hypothetical protein|nr:hypothetical protein [Nocardioidaceae bacterium]
MSTLAIGTLRMPRRRGGAVPDPEPVLEAIVPRSQDHRVLIVRRLRVALGDPAGARDQVEAVRRRADHPVASAPRADAEAIEFADQVEALLCLSRDVLAGVAHHRWWWAGRLPSYVRTPGETLATLWTGQPRLVPKVLAQWAASIPDEPDRALDALGPAASTVLAAVLAEFPAWAVPALEPAASDEPASPVAQLRAVSAAIAGTRPPARPCSTEPAPAAGQVPTDASEPSDMPEPPVRPGPRSPLESRHEAEIADLDEERQRRRIHARPGDDEPTAVAPLSPWTGSGPATESQMATLLYAINLVRWFHLEERVESPGTAWAVVEAVGRNLLRGLPQVRRRTLLADPLLPLLADLDGRSGRGPTPVRLGAAMRPLHRWLADHDVPASAFTQPGRVLVSHTHVDAVLDLELVDLAARASGLDQDPGWVPSLGRIVLFHFEGR